MRRMEWTVAVAAVLLATGGCNREAAPAAADAAAPGGSTAAAPGTRPAEGGGFFSAKPKPQPLVLAAGTPLRIRTTSTLSTASTAPGATFAASLEEPLVVGGRMIAGKGSEVEGRVVESDKGGRVKGRAAIAVQLTRLHLADGKTIALSTNSVGREAHSTKKKDAMKIGIGAGIGAAIGAIAGGGKGAAIGAGAGGGAGTGVVLATHGDAAVIAAESVLNFQLREPVTVN